MKAVVVIPARLASTRLPNKALLAETGKPLVCHVFEQASKSNLAEQIIVAGDDQSIIDAVTKHGGTAVMTRVDHPNGSSRIAEVAESLSDDIEIIVNVQGDEPEIDPALIDRLIERMRATNEPMATIASAFTAEDDPENPNMVKVVLNQRSCAMYFSRSCIPYDRDGENPVIYKHLGIYAYRTDFIKKYVELTPTPHEQTEKLEQLRVLEHGYPIGVVISEQTHPGIDTPEQYQAFVKRFRNGNSIVCD